MIKKLLVTFELIRLDKCLKCAVLLLLPHVMTVFYKMLFRSISIILLVEGIVVRIID